MAITRTYAETITDLATALECDDSETAVLAALRARPEIIELTAGNSLGQRMAHLAECVASKVAFEERVRTHGHFMIAALA